MTKMEDRIIRRLEAQVERAQARLDAEPRRSSPIGFFGGLALGTVAGALLTFFFTRDEEDLPDDVASGADETIVLRDRSIESVERSSTPRPLVAMPTTPEEGVTDQLAAAELESPQAVQDIAREATSTGTETAPSTQATWTHWWRSTSPMPAWCATTAPRPTGWTPSARSGPASSPSAAASP